MKINGEYTFDAPQDFVWNALRDPDVLGSIMPGGEGIEEVGENEYAGNLKIKVGPVQGKFKGKIKLSDIVEPDSYKMEVDGKGAPGFVKATGAIQLTDQGEQTHMAYEGDAKIGGRIASVGQRLMDTSAKAIIRQSLEALNEYLKVQAAAQAAAQAAEATEEEVAEAVAQAPVPEYVPPSQAELAANVAKEVAGEMIPAQYRPYLIGAAVVIVILILLANF
ncbi:MAG: carbon monoxide dehydrogenase subunit G [Chloroflexota bacterium]